MRHIGNFKYFIEAIISLFTIIYNSYIHTFYNYDKCSICLEYINNKSDIVITKCNHKFCFPCIILYIKTNNTCPLCRKLLSNNISIDPEIYKINYEIIIHQINNMFDDDNELIIQLDALKRFQDYNYLKFFLKMYMFKLSHKIIHYQENGIIDSDDDSIDDSIDDNTDSNELVSIDT